MDRVEQNSIGEVLSKTWRDTAGNIVDPGAVTITMTRADGTVLVSGATTSGGGAAPRTYTLTTTHTSLLELFTVVWTSSTYGPRTPEYVEVAGGFLFGIAEARSLKPLDSTTNYPTASLIEMRTMVELELESACERAFVPRYMRERVNSTGNGVLRLSWPYVSAIRDVTVVTSGVATALTPSELSLLTFDPLAGILAGYNWPAGYGNVIVGYEHGTWDHSAKRYALMLTRSWLTGQSRPIDDRAITYSSDAGGTYSLAVPGRNGSVFGHPDVDTFVARKNMSVNVA